MIAMRITILLAMLVSGCVRICCSTEIELESFAKNADSIPIGIVSFKSLSSTTLLANKPEGVIASDLEFSGRFTVVRSAVPDTALFGNNNVQMYINGDYSVNGNDVQLHCFLQSVDGKQILLNRTFGGTLQTLRAMAHRYGDELVQRLFADKPFFESKILFVKDEGRRKNIMIMDYDGFDRRQLTFCDCMNILPAFADSATFVWTSYSRGQAGVYGGALEGGGQHPLVTSRYVETSACVSAITGRIAFSSGRQGSMEIYTCNMDGSAVTRLTGDGGVDIAPCWSPTSAQIAFTSDRDGTPHIYVMDADGSNERRLTFDGDYQDTPAWSPKGDKIAYASMTLGEFEIWTIQADGSNATQLTSPGGSKENPVWSPSASYVAFSCKIGKGIDIYAIRADGTHLTKITNTGNAKMPAWALD